MLSSGFYNSKGGDRKYDAEQFGAMFNGLITDGVFAHYKDALKVTAGSGNRELVVKPGRAWFNGTWTEVDDNGHSIYLMGSVTDATYFVYLTIDKRDRENSIAWYSEIRNDEPDKELYFYLLAQVTIPGGTTKIADSMITDTRGSDLCPYVTGIMETVSFEEIAKQVCGENWKDWLGVYEAGITTGVQNAVRASEQALSEVKSLKSYAVDTEAVSYIWAKFEAIPTDGGGFEWVTDEVHTELTDPPMPMYLYRELSYSDLGDGSKPNIVVSNPYKPSGENTAIAIPASIQANVWREYPYFLEGGANYGDNVLRYDDLQRTVLNIGGQAKDMYRYRTSRLVHIPVIYERGEYLGTVTADNATAYPRNGHKGGYWYVRFSAMSSDVFFSHPDMTSKNVEDAIAELRRSIGSGNGSPNPDGCACGPVYVASEEPPENTEALWLNTTPPVEAVALGATAVETDEGVDIYCTDELGTTKASLRHGKDGNDSGQNLDYSAAFNKPSINGVTLEGNKTAEQLGIGQPTNEQVSAAVEAHLIKNPVAAGATPEQVAQIAANTQSANVLNTVMQNSLLYEWPGLTDERVPKYEGGSIGQKIDTGSLSRRAVSGHRYLVNNSIILHQGDMIITNADCAADAPNQYIPVLLKKGDKFTTAYNIGTPVVYGRAAFDGQYITYTATDPVEYIQISYKADVDYEVKVYVASSRADEVTIPVSYAAGYIKQTTGAPTYVGDGTTLYPSGYYTEQMTNLITVSAPGKFLLVKNATLNNAAGGIRSGFVWARYAEDGETMTYGHLKGNWDLSKNYYVIPLIADTEYIRFAFTASANPLERLECMVVDRNYLVRSGYGLYTYGKSMTAFGDSYIGEWASSVSGVKFLARNNLMEYTPFGHNGWGIAASPNYAGGLVENAEAELGSTDTDYYIIQAGRNDYNCQVPLGSAEDVHGPDVPYTQRTFRGALNWLCQWMVRNKPTKKVVFFTPWFFPPRTASGDDEGNGTGSEFVETHKPVEYIDAIIEIAGMWGIPVLDCARDAGMHVRDEAFRTAYYRSADDVSHLNADGAALFAENVQRRFEVL